MTINIADNNPRVSYSVSAGVTQTSFAVPFEFFDETDVLVYIDSTLKTISTDYTVSGGDGTTGTITMSVTGPATVALVRDITIERSTDFPTAGPFSVQSLNVELDKQIAIDADISDQIDRAVRSPIEEFTTMTLPDAADRAEKILKFDNAGNVTVESASALFGGAVVGANFTNNTFTGDGSQTAFTTTVEAGSKNNAQVYIDGVYQLKSSFSVSGFTLTFTEAPPLNSQIEVIIGKAIDTLDADSGNINYNQGGTGAQTRTVENKLQDVVSVKDFGATGDGVTDDTAAIQAALTYVHTANPTGKGLYFPSGTYIISSSLTVGSVDAGDIILFGDKTILKTANTTIQGIIACQGPSSVNRGGRIRIRGLAFEGASKTDANIGLYIQDMQGVDIEDCKFSFLGKGIRTYFVDIVNISHKNYISHCTTGIENDGPSGGQANTHNILGNLINQCTTGIEYKGGFGATIAFNEIDNNDTHIRCGYDASVSVDARGINIIYNKFESASGGTPRTIVLGGGAGICTDPYVARNTILHADTETIFTVANIQGNGRIKNNNVAPASPAYTKTLINQGSSVTKAVFSEADTLPSGTVSFGAADTTKTITLPVAEPDTNYNIQMTVNGAASTPATNSYIISDIQKTTTNFQVTVVAAPGGVAAVSWAWQLTR